MARFGTLEHELTPARRRAIAALLVERDTRAAAATAKVGERTLRRWLQEPVFTHALQEAQAALINTTMRRLASACNRAVDELNNAMSGVDNPAAVKIRAADIVLQRLLNLKEIVELEQRVAVLEAAQNGKP